MPNKKRLLLHSFRTLFVRVFLTFVLSVVILFISLGFFEAGKSSAASTTFTSRSDWNSGTSTSVESDTRAGDLQLQADGVWGPRNLDTPPENVTTGSAYVDVGDYIYSLLGNSRNTFWRYSVINDKWTVLPNAPFGAGSGSDLTVIGNTIYAIFGGNQTAFASYSIDLNTWTTLDEFPGLASGGSTIASDGATYVYGLRGNGSQDYYRYDPSTNNWSILAGPPATIGTAADLVYVGGALYTPRGVSTNTFYKYQISNNTWTTLTNITATLNSEAEMSTDGTSIYAAQSNGGTGFYRYSISGNSWASLTVAPATVNLAGGPIYHSNDGFIYFVRGNSTKTIWKYNIGTNSYVGPVESTQTMGIGSDLIYNGGYLYNPRGLNTNTFQRYNIASNVWEARTSATQTFNDDTKGVSVGQYLYFFRGSTTNEFYRYDTVGNSWSTMATALLTVRFGGTLAYPGSGDYIYATRGNDQLTFWRYSISGNSWDDAGAADLPADTEASYGARLISDGTNIYYIPGVGIKRFLRYNVVGNTWTELSAPPFAPNYGTDLAYGGGKILALEGNYETGVWEYSISDTTWRRLPSISGFQGQNYGPYQGASIEYNGSSAFYVTRGNTLSDMTTYTPGVANYPANGNWISPSKDLTYVTSWTSLSATATVPGDSSITIQTRTSSNNTSWSSWQTVSGGVISSPTNRYIQVKAILGATSDLTQTPVLSALNIVYNGDVTAPTNPSSVSGSSQEVAGVSLVSGSSYTYNQPFFSWTGSTDAGVGISGYYVYFGTNASADPQVNGSFQTDANYLVTTAMSSGTYYLRVRVKDLAENVSAATTLFTYIYSGISPPTTVTATSSSDFNGSATNISNSNNELKLSSKAGFWLNTRLSTTPAGLTNGSADIAYVGSSNMMYVFQGNGTAFYRYNIATDVWSSLAVAPAAVGNGGAVVEGPTDYIYGLRGGGTTTFWRYSITGNTWTPVASAPNTIANNASMVYDGSRFIYVTRGSGDDAFWRYDTQSDTWDSMADALFGAPISSPSNLIGAGSALVIDTAEGLIYSLQGNATSSMSVYSILSNSWTVLPDVPYIVNSGTAMAYDPTTKKLYVTVNDANEFYEYDINDQVWSRKQDTPGPFGVGAALRQVGNYIYAVRGGSSTSFYRYTISRNSWEVATRNLFSSQYLGTSYQAINYGADLVKDNNGYLYLTRGNYSDDFVRYDPATGDTVTLSKLPIGSWIGSSMEYVGTNDVIYYLPGSYVQRMYYYTISTDTWTEVTTDPPPFDVNHGSSIAYDGTRYLYLNQGSGTTTFSRYDTQGSAGSRWLSRAVIPGAVGYGAELIYRGGFIYTLRGNNVANNPFYRYDTSNNTWSDAAVADLNTTIYNDGFLIDGNDGNLYATRGANNAQWYRYSIGSNTWTLISPDLPMNVTIGGTGYSDMSYRMFMMPGAGTNSYGDALYTYIQQTPTSSFQETGEYTSQAHDVGSIFAWANLNLTYQTATNNTLTVQTRTSANGVDWSNWADVSKLQQTGTSYTYKINSPAQRFIQVRLGMMSGDGIFSAIVSDYTISYYRDTVAPNNPSDAGFTAYSSNTMATSISASTWYNHTAPYFSWAAANAANGASDPNGSGVKGYYVYFGTNASADPATDGTFQTGTTYTAGSLATDQTYYLRIKAQDNANNTSASSWQPFVYFFDNSAPPELTGLSASPTGYTATDSFSFAWDAASAGTGSPIVGYCYKTGTATGALSTDQCISQITIAGIGSYATGANTFYVRAVDAAGNYSPYKTIQFYYNATAPSPPTGIQASPQINTVNNFAFTWDLPESFQGNPAKITFYYSVNVLPTPQSVLEASGTSLFSGPYATVPGDNILYVVAKDEAGNIDYNLYTSVTFTAETSAPGIPMNLDIADISVKQSKSWKLALSWEAPTSADSGIENYQIYRSYDGSTFEFNATARGISYVDTQLQQRVHWYKVRACDSTNNCGAFSNVVSLYPDGKFTEPAKLVDGPDVSNVSTKRATISWVTERTADSKVAYGLKPGEYFDIEVANSTQVIARSLNLTNLSAGTTYYYIAKWTDEDGNTGSSAERSFTTSPAPSVSSVTESNIGISSALITFRVKGSSKVDLLYGNSTTYGGLVETLTAQDESTYSVQLGNLTDGTQYHYKLMLRDIEGDQYEFEDHTFNTLPRPKIENVKVQQIKGTAQPTVLISWFTNTEVTSIVSYYPTSNQSQSRDEVDVKLVSGEHKMVLRGLSDTTNYSLVVKGRDRVGNEGASSAIQFTTASDTRPPQVSNLVVEGSIVPTRDNGDPTAQLVVSWNTDEPTTSQVEFAEGTGTTYSQKTQEDTNLTVNHVVAITGLSPSKVYHFRAVGRDGAGNLGASVDTVSITPKATDSALDLVISSLSEIFSFLKGL
ncbi:hypothetical protein HGA91_05180 [candidate division WWE3 bacterium]|nr:hypothetical protein [candidate division WWE3 bacterium]